VQGFFSTRFFIDVVFPLLLLLGCAYLTGEISGVLFWSGVLACLGACLCSKRWAFRLTLLMLFIAWPGVVIVTWIAGYHGADPEYDQHTRIMMWASVGIATYIAGLMVYASELRRTGKLAPTLWTLSYRLIYLRVSQALRSSFC
jgi:hypothetical protein